MTFFYDLNKRMAELSQKQTLAEHSVPAVQPTKKSPMTQALNERDMGKHNNATTGFAALAKKAGKEYGSKAAGERVAGAQFQKMKKAGQLEEQGQLNELSPELLKRASDAAGMKWAHADDRKDKKASEKYSAQNDKFHSAMRKKQKDVDESAFQAAIGKKKYGDEGMKALQKAGREHASDTTMKNIRNRYDKYDESQGMTDEGNAFAKAVVDAKRDGIQPGEKIHVGGKDIPLKEKLSPAKQKSFAALAPPRDKITFADKIAGAKKEVDEMLGDVAAEAMRSAVTKMHGTADMAEDFDDMQRDVKKRMGPKVGDVKRGARHDIETTATGIRATRRHDDEEDTQPTGEKRKAGRPKGADKGPERVTGKAYKHKGGRVKEDGMEDMIEPHDSGEYDHEGEMAKDSIKTVVRHAQALEKILGDNDNLPEWVQSKLAKIESMMTAVDDYMQNQEGDDEMAMDEEKTSTRDSRAERAGRKVAKDIEYDEKKKDGIHGKRRGSEDDKAEKAGKRVTKDIEYDEKKKEKKVDETTTSGSVATGGDAPKATKGGMQIGKGIYDSLNREVEGMIAESMSINVSMTKDDNGSHKNITVTAADEDAEALAQLLRSAGLGGDMSHDHGHEEPCPDCGSTDCGCDEGMAEAYGDTDATQNKPDWPTNTEYNDDAMQYSGGLNKPKTDVAGDGQTTIPVTAVHTQDEDELRRMMEMAGIKQQELKPWEHTMKEEAVEEGVVDTVKDVVKKGIDALKGPDDDKLLSKLEKETGGKRPEKKDEKMQESLMREFANFKI